MSNIPASVLAGAAEADATLAELAAAAAAPPSPVFQVVEGGAVPPAPAPQAPAAPAAPTPAAVPADLTEELRRARDFIATQNGRLQAQADQMRELQRAMDELRATPRSPSAPPAPPQSLITDKDREEYGEDLLGLITRVVKEHVGSAIDQLALRMNALEANFGKTSKVVEHVQQTTQSSADDRYFAALDAKVPTWEATNGEPPFVDWLKKRDKLSGETFYNLLASAHQQRSVDRVVEVFRAYKPELVMDSPAAPAPSTPPPQQPSGRIDPNELAAPVTTAPAAPPTTPTQGPIWTQADVNKLYDDKTKGRMSQADFDRMEKQYHQALIEGRVSTE